MKKYYLPQFNNDPLCIFIAFFILILPLAKPIILNNLFNKSQ